MSERKVLNKYYPPDFDPTKLPKLKRERNRQFVIRIMAPFSMRCKTCGEYIYKGRKFNSRMETVENENYLGLRIYRFYIRCTKCITEITFKTDPKNSDYVMEHGATRNFESYRRLEEKIARERKEEEQEEAENPMKALENRTRDSKREMESIEKLEELKDLNTRIASIDQEKLIEDHVRTGQKLIEDEVKRQEAEDEMLVRQIFGGKNSGGDGYLRRIIDDGSDNDEETAVASSIGEKRKATDFLVDYDQPSSSASYSTAEPTGFGPTPDPNVKKAKLKTPFDELAAMVKVKKKKKDTSDEKVDTSNSIDIRAKDANEKDKDDKKSQFEVSEPAPLPTYKINLKKQTDSGKTKMKGASLSLLGGYDSGSSNEEEE